MAYEIGFVDNAGTEGLAHWQMLLKIKTFAEANGWTTLRYVNPTDGSNRELIMQGVGLSGTEQIFIGFRTYHLAAADYYNMTVAAFTGYVAALAFTAQPGYIERGVCAHNQRIDYWLAVNGQRIAFGFKIGAPSVYEIGYVGKFFPYATPSQYPYPMALCGMLPSPTPATRYSDTSTTHATGVRGNNINGYLRDLMGNWVTFSCLPWTADFNNSPTIRRDSGGYYHALPSVLFNGSVSTNQTGTDSGNVLGELDGIRYLSGFNNVSENTCTIAGKSNVLFGDGWRTGIGDYFLLEMN